MAAPLRVGVLNDMAASPGSLGAVEPWLRFAADELIGSGRLDREVEFVHAGGLGLPAGTAAAVERAYAQLVEQDVLLIVGPAIGDNALVATPLAERHRIPTLNWAGTERARGDYMFHLQVGSHEDESIVLARHLAAIGAGRAGVIYDRSPIGRRHLDFLMAEAERLGLRLAAAASTPPLAADAADEVAAVLAAGAEAIAYLGLGYATPAVSRALAARGWSGPRVMNTSGMRGYAPDYRPSVEGWVYIDMCSDGNATLASLRERPGAPVVDRVGAPKGYDLGRLVAEGLARAPELTREGVVAGLEAIKWIPAAEGYEGTVLSFGRHDRGALHGRYLVLRAWRDGDSVEL